MVPGENSFPGLQMVAFSLSSHGREKEKPLLYLYGHQSHHEVPTLLPNYLPKAPLPNIITLGVKVWTCELGGHNSQCITSCLKSTPQTAFPDFFRKKANSCFGKYQLPFGELPYYISSKLKTCVIENCQSARTETCILYCPNVSNFILGFWNYAH